MDWYKNQMSDWTLIEENSFSSPDRPTVYTQYYRKSDNGAFIFASSDPEMGGTILGIVTGTWSSIQECGGFEEDTQEGEGEEGGGAVDWGGAYVFTDPKGDFWLGEDSPPQVIEYPPSDIIKIYMTNDNLYLYFKFEVDGEIPTLPLAYDGDNVCMITMTCAIDSDQNRSTGNTMNYSGADLALDAFLGSPSGAGGEFYSSVEYYLYDPSAEEGTGEPKSGTLLAGGAGENFVTMRFSLADLNLESGMRLDILPWVEVESDLYHHFARDVYPAEGEWVTDIEIL